MTPDQLEAELDRLFQLPPAEMVKARNALADQLRKLGDKAAAARVKSLVRPTPAAWALNRLHVEEPALLERAHLETERVRALHADQALDPMALRQAISAQRAAVAALVAAAERCCAAGDVPYGLTHQRKLLSTVQGFLAGVGDERPGRMTRDLEPAGFAAVQVVASSAAPATQQKPLGSVDSQKSLVREAEAQALSSAHKELERQQERAQLAHAQVLRCKAEHLASQATQQALAQRILEAEQALIELREQQQHNDSTLHACSAALIQALAEAARADEARAEARQTLQELEGEAS